MHIAPSRAESSEPDHTKADEKGWYVAYTQPKREQVAQENLQLQGFEAYLFQYKTFKKMPGACLEVWQPMFPRYIFFRPGNPGQSISGARSTRGIAFILRFGLINAVLKPEEFQLLQALENERNQADADQASCFKPGLKVRLQNCGLSGLEGIVHSVSAKRVTLLIELLGRQKKVDLEHQQLELVQL